VANWGEKGGQNRPFSSNAKTMGKTCTEAQQKKRWRHHYRQPMTSGPKAIGGKNVKKRGEKTRVQDLGLRKDIWYYRSLSPRGQTKGWRLIPQKQHRGTRKRSNCRKKIDQTQNSGGEAGNSAKLRSREVVSVKGNVATNRERKTKFSGGGSLLKKKTALNKPNRHGIHLN